MQGRIIRSIWVLVFVHVVVSGPTAANESLYRASTYLSEAKAHLDVLPEKALTLLSDGAHLRQHLAPQQQLSWSIIQISAARRVADQDMMLRGFDDLAAMTDVEGVEQHRTVLLNSLGVWFRREGHFHQAKLCYLCALQHAEHRHNQLKSTLNIAVVLRNQGKFEEALALNQQLLAIAHPGRHDDVIASVLNNIGMIYLSLEDYQQAADYFKQAMDSNQRAVRRAGEILNGINLLLTFVLDDQDALFERLYPRVERMLTQYPDSARGAYLQLVYGLYLADSGRLLSDQLRLQLTERYQHVNDIGIQTLVYPAFKKMQLAVLPPRPENKAIAENDLLERFPLCDWQQIQQLTVSTLFKDVISGNNG